MFYQHSVKTNISLLEEKTQSLLFTMLQQQNICLNSLKIIYKVCIPRICSAHHGTVFRRDSADGRAGGQALCRR